MFDQNSISTPTVPAMTLWPALSKTWHCQVADLMPTRENPFQDQVTEAEEASLMPTFIIPPTRVHE